MTLPTPTPRVDPENRPFFEAAAHGRLTLKRCRACAAVIWYPRAVCPECWSTDTEWFDASGRGTVYSFSIVRRGLGAFAAAGPYVLAYVELAEGPRVLTNIVTQEPEAVEIDSPVEVCFDPVGDGELAVPRFRIIDNPPRG